jgi:hypothetical protein
MHTKCKVTNLLVAITHPSITFMNVKEKTLLIACCITPLQTSGRVVVEAYYTHSGTIGNMLLFG